MTALLKRGLTTTSAGGFFFIPYLLPLGAADLTASLGPAKRAGLPQERLARGLVFESIFGYTAGSIIKHSHYWRRGSWSGKRSGGKKWTPAMTFPQVRKGIAVILREAFQCGTMSHMLEERQKRLRRNELARFDHWKQRKLLAPLNLHKRLF